MHHIRRMRSAFAVRDLLAVGVADRELFQEFIPAVFGS